MTAIASERRVLSVPLVDIYADEEFNCRGAISPGDVIDLAKDIESRGRLIQPVTIAPITESRRKKMLEAALTPEAIAKAKNYKYLLIAGYRRMMSHRVLNWANIDAILDEHLIDESEARLFNLSENLQRKDLNVLQEAQAIKKLRDLGMSRESVASKTGMSMGWVQIRYMLLDLPPEIQEEVRAGLISQPQIRDIYTMYTRNGREAAFQMTRDLKDAKIKGVKTRAVHKVQGKVNIKRHRKRAEIFGMLQHVQDHFPNGLYTRALAWAAGEISDYDFYDSLGKFAKELSIAYTNPAADQPGA